MRRARRARVALHELRGRVVGRAGGRDPQDLPRDRARRRLQPPKLHEGGELYLLRDVVGTLHAACVCWDYVVT